MLSFIHLSDLHIGKKLHGYDLHEDQKYILNQILEIIENRKPDAVLIAGDVYDKTTPSEEAVALLSDFLESLQACGSEIFVISGNHDPGEKLSFLSQIVEKSGLHIEGKFNGVIPKRSVANADIYLLPYIRIADARRYFPDSVIDSTSDAISKILESVSLDPERINVLIAHQAVLGANLGGSEDTFIGGETPVPSSLFSNFDYVALGHIHRAQAVGAKNIRYAGSILKYSTSERMDKTVIYGEISDDGSLEIEEIKLKPLHNLVVKKGAFADIIGGGSSEDYIHVVLTDETDVPDAVSTLGAKFPRFLSMEYDNTRTKTSVPSLEIGCSEKERTPEEYFDELFSLMTKKKMREEQKIVIDELIKGIWGNER